MGPCHKSVCYTSLRTGADVKHSAIYNKYRKRNTSDSQHSRPGGHFCDHSFHVSCLRLLVRVIIQNLRVALVHLLRVVVTVNAVLINKVGNGRLKPLLLQPKHLEQEAGILRDSAPQNLARDGRGRNVTCTSCDRECRLALSLNSWHTLV